MPAEFDDLNRELESLGTDTRHVSLPGAAAARRRARERARNQAVAAVVGAVAIVAGGVFAFAQPSLISAPDVANSPTDSASPTAEPSPEPTNVPSLTEAVLLQAADLDLGAGWVETDPPVDAWPCAPQPPDGEQVLLRSFEFPEGTGRIDQIVEATAAAQTRLAEIRHDVLACVAAGNDFDLDEVWEVSGIGEETVLIRYWAPPREEAPGEGRLIVSISLVRSGAAVASVTHGGFATDANQPDTTDQAEAAAGRLCAETDGACVSEIRRVRVFPEPAQDIPGWLTPTDVIEATGIAELTTAGEVIPVPEGTLGFVCFESNSGDAGAAVESRTYDNPMDPGGDSVQQAIAQFTSVQAATAHYETLVVEGDACTAEPSLSVENLGTIGGGATGFEGTVWRATAAGSDAVFFYGVVVQGSAVAFVDLQVMPPDEAQIRNLLTIAGERLGEAG
jgi:hypothetical protein